MIVLVEGLNSAREIMCVYIVSRDAFLLGFYAHGRKDILDIISWPYWG